MGDPLQASATLAKGAADDAADLLKNCLAAGGTKRQCDAEAKEQFEALGGDKKHYKKAMDDARQDAVALTLLDCKTLAGEDKKALDQCDLDAKQVYQDMGGDHKKYAEEKKEAAGKAATNTL